jgi:protoheme IX farnesyltransferase
VKADYRSYLALCKIRVALLSAFSTFIAYLLAAPSLNARFPVVVSGVFILACGSLALNQYQEREIDAAMPRTRPRPIPSRLIKPVHALFWSLLLLCSGLFALLCIGNPLACTLGLLALFWYNGIYTYLKRKTAFAAIPGALIGAIPPAIGWVAGGGALQDPKLVVLCFFFFIWQVPHSWLLIMRYGREYEEASLPILTQVFSSVQMKRIVFVWMCAAAVSSFFLSAVGFIHYLPVHMMLLALSSWFVWSGIKHLLSTDAACASLLAFKNTGYYLAAVLFLLSLDKWFDTRYLVMTARIFPHW